MDHDVYTTDATVGIVYVDTNCLLMRDGYVIQGWFPVYDTLLGVRCELSLVIRLQYFGDVNPFRESSAGVQFFGLSTLDPSLYRIERMLGFVEELVVHADPEYSWSDNFRTSRKSNEHRQLLLYKLSSQVVTMVGKKALELGGNAVLAYKQFFDVKGDSGLVARACGTACYITPVEKKELGFGESGRNQQRTQSEDGHDNEMKVDTSKDEIAAVEGDGVDAPMSPRYFPRRVLKSLKAPEVFNISAHDEVQLITLKVSDQETRDSWWLELREEIRAHAQSLQCPFVIGYTESCTIYDDVCVISASGTAAVLKNPLEERPTRQDMVTSNDVDDNGPDVHAAASPILSRSLSEFSTSLSHRSPSSTFTAQSPVAPPRAKLRRSGVSKSPCLLCHIPYSRSLGPFSNMRMVRCGVCGSKWVPEMMIASIEPPVGLAMMEKGAFIQARVCRHRRKGNGDVNATIVSNALPFVEYELYRQLIVKMKVLGVNAVFAFDSQIQVGGSLIVGVITGTGLYLPALPPPPTLRIERNIDVKDDEDRRLVQLQTQIEELSKFNTDRLHRDCICIVQPEHDFCTGSRNAHNQVQASNSHSSDQDNENEKGFGRSLQMTHFRSSRRPRRRQLPRPPLDDGSGNNKRPRTWNAQIITNAVSAAAPEIVAMLAAEGTGDSRTPSASQTSLDSKTLSSSSESSSEWEEEAFVDGYSDSKKTFVLEIDDETDEDLMSVLLEQELPEGIYICNTDRLPGDFVPAENVHLIVSMKRRLNVLLFSNISLLFKVRSYAPCALCGLKTRVAVASETMLEVDLSGMVVLEKKWKDPLDHLLNDVAKAVDAETSQQADSTDKATSSSPAVHDILLCGKTMSKMHTQMPHPTRSFSHFHVSNSMASGSGRTATAVPAPYGREWIELTPLGYIPGAHVTRYLGRVTLHFIKESWTVRESGGLGAFYHLFLSEAIAIVRAHVRSLGGNAMLAFRLVPIESSQLYRNQVYNMISITGDVVMIMRELDSNIAYPFNLWEPNSPHAREMNHFC
ncbi:unnamed protein product [Peronospora destructor]|uniref:Uncharacterized protein n=1 Tax=Peronospora destructor TaxID=86335 RepID=A0AAV0T0M3_9STRA|nr:unnamed protein product [Peronospora destructor]